MVHNENAYFSLILAYMQVKRWLVFVGFGHTIYLFTISVSTGINGANKAI